MSGRVVLVTGAAHGIGLGVARRFRAEGWRVVAADRDAVGEPGLRGVRADVSDEAAVADLVASVAAEEGRLDAVVSNAGFMVRTPLAALTLADWSRVIGTNLTATFLLARAAETLLRASRGSIVTVASTRPTRPAGCCAWSVSVSVSPRTSIQPGLMQFARTSGPRLIARAWVRDTRPPLLAA